MWVRAQRPDQSTKKIAEAEGISESYARKLIARGHDHAVQGKIPRMLTIMNGQPMINGVPNCKHGRPILPGEPLNCVDCDKSGNDHLIAMRPILDKKPKAKEPPRFQPNIKDQKAKIVSPSEWIVALPNGKIHQVRARTKDEAKVILRKILNLKPKENVPRGTVFQRAIDGVAKAVKAKVAGKGRP
jgi:hypothetical protein